jgi:phospholipid transport system substrate-binding protein
MRVSIFKMKPVAVLIMPFLLALGFAFTLAASRASAASPAEQFIADNTQKALAILNNTQLSKDQRKSQFRDFLLGLTDIQAIGRYTLGQYRRTASPSDLAEFDATFKEYAVAVYQSYFNKYTGQTLQVTGSYVLNPEETVVKTVVVDPKKASNKPIQVDFRVLNANGHMLIADFAAEGVWIRELERNDFTGYLGQNGGNIQQLIVMLKKKTAQYR